MTQALLFTSPCAVFGSPDDRKLRSSMTLFARAAGGPSVFRQVLEVYFQDREDPRTLALLADEG